VTGWLMDFVEGCTEDTEAAQKNTDKSRLDTQLFNGRSNFLGVGCLRFQL
jgi:hypothetical protein